MLDEGEGLKPASNQQVRICSAGAGAVRVQVRVCSAGAGAGAGIVPGKQANNKEVPRQAGW